MVRSSVLNYERKDSMRFEMEHTPVTSTLKMPNRKGSTSGSPFNSFSLVRSSSSRAVAIIGIFVVLSRCLANAKPMPRDAGVTSAHGVMVGVLRSI